jgi:hypothetical protein
MFCIVVVPRDTVIVEEGEQLVLVLFETLLLGPRCFGLIVLI